MERVLKRQIPESKYHPRTPACAAYAPLLRQTISEGKLRFYVCLCNPAEVAEYKIDMDAQTVTVTANDGVEMDTLLEIIKKTGKVG